MNDLKGWITGVCLSLLLAGLLKLLAPAGNLGKLMQMVLSLFVLCALCVPLAGGLSVDLRLPDAGSAPAQELEALTDAVNRQTEELAAAKIREQIEIVLAKYDVQNGKISIGMDRTDNGSIFISEIVLYIPAEKAGLKGEIGRTIKSELGLDTRILSDQEAQPGTSGGDGTP